LRDLSFDQRLLVFGGPYSNVRAAEASSTDGSPGFATGAVHVALASEYVAPWVLGSPSMTQMGARGLCHVLAGAVIAGHAVRTCAQSAIPHDVILGLVPNTQRAANCDGKAC
jgi:hypothetical protein